MNPSIPIFILLLAIPAIFQGFASFFGWLKTETPMGKAIFLGIFFAACEYTIKIPILYYGRNNGITPFSVQIIWVCLILLVAYIMDMYSKTNFV